MKFLLFSVSIICLSSAFAQNSEGVQALEKSTKFTMGWVYSPEVAFRVLKEGDDADGLTELLIDMRNDSQQAKFGQSFSVFAGYQFSKLFSLEAGLGYTDFGEAQKPYDIPTPPTVENGGVTIKSSNHLHVVSVPLTLHMNFGGNKVQGFISAGIAPGYLMRYTRYTMYDFDDGSTITSNSYSTDNQELYTKFILGAHFSGGIDYKYSNKASLRIAPVFRMTTNSVFSDDEIRGNYFNAGIEIGTIYKL